MEQINEMFSSLISSVGLISKKLGLSDYMSDTTFFIIFCIVSIFLIILLTFAASGKNILDESKNMIEKGVDMIGGYDTISSKFDKVVGGMNKIVGKNENVSFTLYYVDWCPHYKSVKPEWEKLENDNELKHITITKVNCEENEEIVQEKNIEGFPTILLNNNGKEEAYNGGREYADFKAYLKTV